MEEGELSTFSKTLGDSPRVRILEFFIEGRELDHAKQDVIDDTQLARSTIYAAWDLIEQEELIISRVAGKTKLYRINLNNPVVKQLVKLYDIILRMEFLGLDNERDCNKNIVPPKTSWVWVSPKTSNPENMSCTKCDEPVAIKSAATTNEIAAA